MKMKDLIKKFLRVALILARILFLVCLAAALICLVVGIIVFFVSVGQKNSDDLSVFVKWEETRASANALFGTTAAMIFEASAHLFSLIALPKVWKIFNNAQKKEDAKGCAIVAIVAGVLCSPLAFACAAGILMLIMKDEGYAHEECCCEGECQCEACQAEEAPVAEETPVAEEAENKAE